MPYLDTALIKGLGWGNVIAARGGWWWEEEEEEEWTELEIKWHRKVMNAARRGEARTCYIIGPFSCFCSPPQ